MKRKFLLIVLLVAASAAYANNKKIRDWPFRAPSIDGADNVDPETIGDLVFDTASDTFKGWDGTDWVEFSDSSQTTEVAIVTDQKSSGTIGGASTASTWVTRTLNTTLVGQSWLSLSSNQITLNAGTYLIECRAPASRANAHKARLRDITNTSTAIYGSSEFNSSSNSVSTESVVTGVVAPSSSTTYELQHIVVTGQADGFGRLDSASFGEPEVYSICKITKIN